MAPKKKALSDQQRPPPPPPEPEEDEEEQESSEEEGSEGEEEEEEESEVEEEKEKEKGKPKTPLTQISSQLNKNPSTHQSNSGSESEDEEESEAEEETPHSPSASDFILKHVSPVKPTSKDSKPTSKRPSEPQKDVEKDSRIKKKAKVNEEEVKKEKSLAYGGAGRVWSDEDVIKVLQGMIDYQDQKGVDPSTDMGAFHEFVKGKLQSEFSKTQIYEKVRGLRKKFFNNVEKAEKGEDPVFSKPHEYKAFDLSKRIWGRSDAGGMVNDGVDENLNQKINNGKAKKSGKVGSFVDAAVKEDKKKDELKELVKDDEGDFGSKYPFLCGSFDIGTSTFAGGTSFVKENLSLIGAEKAKELEGKWKKLREAEAEVLIERLNLMREQTKLVLDGMKQG